MSTLKEVRDGIVGLTVGGAAGSCASVLLVPGAMTSATLSVLEGKPEEAKRVLVGTSEVISDVMEKSEIWARKNAAEIVSLTAMAKIAIGIFKNL